MAREEPIESILVAAARAVEKRTSGLQALEAHRVFCG
jgi:hypothetical protein